MGHNYIVNIFFLTDEIKFYDVIKQLNLLL